MTVFSIRGGEIMYLRSWIAIVWILILLGISYLIWLAGKPFVAHIQEHHNDIDVQMRTISPVRPVR